MSFPLLQRKTGWTAFFGLIACFGANAAGLGAVQVQSALGEPLRISIALLGNDTASYEAPCVRAALTSLDGTALLSPIVRLSTPSSANRTIQITTRAALNEPAFNISVETSCGTILRREYQVLLDPPAQASQTLALVASTTLQTPLPPDAKRSARAQRDKEASSKPHAKRHSNKQKTFDTSSSLLAEAPRNVLKVSGGENEKPVITRLEVFDKDSSQSDRSEKEISPNSTTASMDTDKTAETMALIKTMREETQAMRAETERLKQQYAHEHSEMEGMRRESLLWIRILVAVAALCIATIVWLLWRLHTMKKSSSRVAWNEFFPDTTSTTQLGSNTEFGHTTFQITSIDTDESTTLGGESTTLSSGVEYKKYPPNEKSTVEESETESKDAFRYVSGGAIPYIYSDQTENISSPLEIKEDEIAGVMELAEAWMATHDAASVASLLEPFARAEQPQSPLPLLCLLDVYRALGDRAKHDAIRKRIKTIFNVKTADWELPADSQPTRTLADYPHVRQRILELWESAHILPYLNGLVMDKRNGLREGFDLPAYRDILRLKAVVAAGEYGHAMPPQAYAILFPPQRPNIGRTASKADIEPSASNASVSIFPRETTEITLNEPELEIPRQQAEPVIENAAEKPKSFSMREEMSPMAIKLYLAEAYRDIGDKEGACLLLEEVLQEGNPEQVAQALQMLQELT